MKTNFIEESPILFGSLAIGCLIALRYNIFIAVILCLLLVFLFWFYRMPEMTIRSPSPGHVYSACYGTVKQISIDPETNNTHIITFLSPLDVHQQYYPVSGQIISQEYDYTGKFHLAFDIGKSDMNEKIITTIKPTSSIPGNIIVQRIAGFLVHRITTSDHVGDHIVSGDHMGMIKFGSRTDVIIPQGSQIHVSVGDKITRDTLIASYNQNS